jgi:hypothetical protein
LEKKSDLFFKCLGLAPRNAAGELGKTLNTKKNGRSAGICACQLPDVFFLNPLTIVAE